MVQQVSTILSRNEWSDCICKKSVFDVQSNRKRNKWSGCICKLLSFSWFYHDCKEIHFVILAGKWYLMQTLWWKDLRNDGFPFSPRDLWPIFQWNSCKESIIYGLLLCFTNDWNIHSEMQFIIECHQIIANWITKGKKEER